MPLIEQDIPFKEKDKEWIKRNLKAISGDVEIKKTDRIRDLKSRAMWNADQDSRDFEYLTRVGEYDLPAFVRFIPLIRPKGERLKGDFIERPFNYTIFASDEKSIRTRYDRIQQAHYSNLRANLFNQLNQIQAFTQQIYQQLQQPQQTQVQNPDGQIVQGPPPPQAPVIPPEKAMQMQVAQKIMEMEGMMTQEDIRKIEEKIPMSSLEMHEDLARKGLEYLRFTTDLDKKFYDGFEQKIITDKPYFLVDWDNRYENPFLELVNSDNFYYAHDDEIDFVQESEWQCLERYMSISNIITKWRFDLSEEDYQALDQRRQRIGTTSFNYNNFQYTSSYGQFLYSMGDITGLERVRQYWFRSPRRIVWKKVPNKYLPGEFHRKMVDETAIIDEPLRDGEEYQAFYMDEVFMGVQIGDNIFIKLQKKPVVLRSIDKFGKVQLPVMGKACYSKGHRPYSLVYAATDVQVLWNIVHYHKELWMALAGVKGSVMDKSQKPDLMSDTEWRYQRKLGTMWIQSEKRGKQFSFNQFREYDDSLSQGFTQLLNLTEHLDQLCGKIMGISDPRMGNNEPYDKVGNVDRSIRQSTLATESVFWEYDMIRRMACERLINLNRLAWKNGKTASYIDDNDEMVIMNIPPGILYAADYKIHMKPGGLEQKKLEVMRQIVMNSDMAKNTRLSQLGELFAKDNLKELQRKFESIEKEAQQLQQDMMNQQHEQARQLQQEASALKVEEQKQVLNIQGQIDAQLKNMDLQVKQFANQLVEAKNEITAQQTALENELKKYISDQSEATKRAGIESERMTELAYLDEQKRQFDITMEQEQNEKSVDIAGPMTIDRKRKEKIK